MSTRETVRGLFLCDTSSFRTDARSFLDANGLDASRVDRADDDLDALVEEVDTESLSAYERDLCRRVWVLDAAPLGITLAGPAYQDNPVVYVNRTFRELTGYSLDAVRGGNLRLLQGPDTESDAVDTLREALEIWEPVTVELWNYRADGTRFRNCVTLEPLSDDTGTISNWVGLQARVDG